jgi:TRAP-type C4-dicarboxylate transport system permease small subunit
MATNTAKVETRGARLSRLWENILKGTIYASGVLIVIMMVLVSFSVIMRYFVGMPTGWVPDMAGYLQYALVLLGAAWVLKIRKHVKIDVIVVRFSRKTQRIIELVCNCLAFIAYSIFLVVGLRATINAFVHGDFLFKEVKMPVGPLYAFIPVCLLLLCIQIFIDIYSGWRSIRAAPAMPVQPSQPGQAPSKPA